ncbi:MAG: preprotein translocase subunit SecG [Acutalibacteraceae bacterium]|nr:preprotein translocase subunit SecG [Acutalibacteraceae bacterium]
MEVLQIIIGILLGLLSLGLIAIILFQQGHRAGISGAISGAAETFLSKNKARSNDVKLKRYTMYGVIAFFVLAIAATVVATLIS